MNILVLGASGFLGRVIMQKLKTIPDFHIFGTYYKHKGSNDETYLDVTDTNMTKRLIDDLQPEVVIWCIMNKNNEDKIINQGLYNILLFLPSQAKIIFISTDMVFSQGKGNYSENDEPTPMENANPLATYANAKRKGENLVKQHPQNIIIRSGPIFGKDSYNRWDRRTDALLEKIHTNQKIMRINNIFKTFILVDDYANAIVTLININYTGIIHLGSFQRESYFTFAKKLAIHLGLTAELIEPISLSNEEIEREAIPVDTSLNISKSKQILTDPGEENSFKNITA